MDLMQTLESVQEIVDHLELTDDGEILSLKDMYDIALKVQENAIKAEYNKFYAQANVINTGLSVPSALEKIAMELESISQEGLISLNK